MKNIDNLIQKAKEIGHDTIPDPKPVQSEKIILDMLNSKPTRCFKTSEFDEMLRYNDIKTPSSCMLTRLIHQEKCKRIKIGIYRAKLQFVRQPSFLEKIKLNLQKILLHQSKIFSKSGHYNRV